MNHETIHFADVLIRKWFLVTKKIPQTSRYISVASSGWNAGGRCIPWCLELYFPPRVPSWPGLEVPPPSQTQGLDLKLITYRTSEDMRTLDWNIFILYILWTLESGEWRAFRPLQTWPVASGLLLTAASPSLPSRLARPSSTVQQGTLHFSQDTGLQGSKVTGVPDLLFFFILLRMWTGDLYRVMAGEFQELNVQTTSKMG